MFLMKTTFHLIRHGQTNWNLEGRYQGQKDIPLNETGKMQAHQTGEKLMGKYFSAIYSSDLIRTKQTAQIIADTLGLLVIQTDSRLREIYQGEWEGQYFFEIKNTFPEKVASIRANPLHDRPPGGESIGEVAKRMIQVLDEIAIRYPCKDVLIISHGMSIATVISLTQGYGLEQAANLIPDNGVITTIEWKNTPFEF